MTVIILNSLHFCYSFVTRVPTISTQQQTVFKFRIFEKMKLGKHLFWDTNPDNVDYEKHARKVIERVVTRGRLEDWHAIKEYYGLEKIKTEVVQIRSLDYKTHTFLSTILRIPKEDFRCYSNRLLNQPHFPY